MKKLFEKWKAKKKKISPLPGTDLDESWLGGEAMVHPKLLEEKNVKQKKRKR